MKRRSGAVAAAVALLLVAPLVSEAGSARGAVASRLVYLADVLPRLGLARLLGPAPAAAPMTVTVALAHPDPAGEAAAYAATYNPASPQYHHFLAPSAYAARFGVPAATVAAAERWLTGGGLRVVQTSAAGDLVQARGSTGAVGHLFRTGVGSYSYRGRSFVANTSAPAVPAGLPVATVIGLNTLQRFQPLHTAPAPAATGAARAGAAGGTFDGTFNERDLWKIYDLPDSDYGQGQSMAIFGSGSTGPVIANLRVFEQRQGLPQVPVRVVHTEPGAYGDVSGEAEWNIDSAAATGMAPMAKRLDYYFAKTLADADIVTAFAAWANDPNGPLQASASFGECETDPLNPLVGSPLLNPPIPYGLGLGDNMELATEPILRQATMEGRTLFASAGDTAGLCPAVSLPVIGPGNGVLPGTAPIQSYPAVSRYAVAVGGTVLTSNAARTTRVKEVSWTFTGGGPSGFVSEPGFQKPITAVDRRCLLDPRGKPYPPGTVCRGVPDIAADSSGGVPAVSSTSTYDVTEDMVDTGEGGTSLSAPLADGMWARIQAGAPAGGLGFADESLYRVATGPHYHRDFYDVTASELGVGNLADSPGPGWDYTSGLGVPDVAHLMDDLDGRRTPTDPVGPPAVPANPVGGDCRPVITSSAGNATDPVTLGNDAPLDFTTGQFALAPDGRSLVVTMAGPGLAPSPVLTYAGGTSYTVLWTYGATTYFAQALVAPGGAVTYHDGHVDPVAGMVADHVVAGTFTGGRLQFSVPLADVGRPPVGARLRYPYGVTGGALANVPGVVIVLSQTADAGSTDDYVVGYRCPKAG